jgi:hypothetical protein
MIYKNNEIIINKFTTSFVSIIKTNTECMKQKTRLTDTILEMKTQYSIINKSNTKNTKQQQPMFTFCLDTFFNQYKIYAIELENINTLWILHNNRMYTDYYKLYHIIVKYIVDTNIPIDNIDETYIDTKIIINDNSDILHHKYVLHKENEPSTEYIVEDICQIHETILKLIRYICIYIQNIDDEILNYNTKHKAGFSISNYLNAMNYNKSTTVSQLTLYINYISFFHISQQKNLTKLTNNINSITDELVQNISMDKMFSMDDIGKFDLDQLVPITKVYKPTNNDIVNTQYITQFNYNRNAK